MKILFLPLPKCGGKKKKKTENAYSKISSDEVEQRPY